MSDTATGRVLAAAAAEIAAVDAAGRRLQLRRLTALDKLRLYKAAGTVLAENVPWLGVALLAASVTMIDDMPLPLPTTEAHIEALVARLGEHGLEAAAAALSAAEDGSTAAGNLPGIPT